MARIVNSSKLTARRAVSDDCTSTHLATEITVAAIQAAHAVTGGITLRSSRPRAVRWPAGRAGW